MLTNTDLTAAIKSATIGVGSVERCRMTLSEQAASCEPENNQAMRNKRNSTARMADTLVVMDFETTGLSPDQGDRAIEIGAVLLQDGQVRDRFQSLMNPGMRVSGFIEAYTGITNQMLASAPSCRQVMSDFADFVGDRDLVAHNASFDRRFMDAEMHRIHRNYPGDFLCSLLVARRLYQDAPNHKLGSLVTYKQIPNDGTFHRALADAEMTAHLWLHFLADIQARSGIDHVPVAVMQKLSTVPRRSIDRFLSGLVE